jgi:hypothetical protein
MHNVRNKYIPNIHSTHRLREHHVGKFTSYFELFAYTYVKSCVCVCVHVMEIREINRLTKNSFIHNHHWRQKTQSERKIDATIITKITWQMFSRAKSFFRYSVTAFHRYFSIPLTRLFSLSLSLSIPFLFSHRTQRIRYYYYFFL